MSISNELCLHPFQKRKSILKSQVGSGNCFPAIHRCRKAKKTIEEKVAQKEIDVIEGVSKVHNPPSSNISPSCNRDIIISSSISSSIFGRQRRTHQY
ncbi:hypothetical protein TNCT_58971 [Trichonephila clavata]|uniref:Uncharacterized protein n=1 Tax=Trichonephila clavata TaxID=2740835 RepID=A0A8X6GPT3_TRICU|nr:hypothetical protein TNCT_58971 [Trichonephila clavata]